MLTGLPATLLLTLRARAQEHTRPDRLLADPVAARWFAPFADALPPEMADAYSPVFQLGTAVRAHLYDAVTRRFLARHPGGRIIELGAGLSTRFYRLPSDTAHWVELDLPPAIRLRRQVETAVAHHTLLPASMLDPDWPAQLPPAAPADTLLIAEGVLFFLDPDAIADLFRLLHTHFSGATIALDVLTTRFSRRARRRFAGADIPMRWLVDDEANLTTYGLTLQDSQVVTHLFPKRWQELGFDPVRLREGKGNIVVEAKLETKSTD